MRFFTELKRRNVLRVGIAYAVVAWLLLQVSDTLVPALRLPEWFHSGVALLLILGFPVALIFAWAFELTPEGLKKEGDVDPSNSIASVTGRKLDFVIIGLLVVTLGYLGYGKSVSTQQRNAALLESATQQDSELIPGSVKDAKQAELEQPSIAVLAFVNMSADVSNEYFSDGLSEELLNLLVKIPELRVAARTSSFSYKGKDVKVAQIGAELNVTHVLEGSVRKAGNHVRITAQLIKTDDGFHLWSETFDRTLDDIFVIQDEIASAVVDALRVQLLVAMPTKEVTDPEVFALHLQGLYFDNLKGKENWEKAVSAFRQALAIDPEYAPSWVGISKTYHYQTISRLLSRETGSALARAAVDRALAIDSNLASAWAGLAMLKAYYEWDWDGATAAIDSALQLEPNNVQVLGAAASLAVSLGQTSAATAFYERALAKDPLNLTTLNALGQDYMRNGRLDEAIETLSRLVALNPAYPWGYSNLARSYFLKGDAEHALILINKNPSGPLNSFEKAVIHFALGNRTAAQAFADEYLEQSSREFPFWAAALYSSLGDKDKAFEWLETALGQRDGGLSFFLNNTYLRNLESDPRYPIFLQKLGLLEAWKSMSREYGGH